MTGYPEHTTVSIGDASYTVIWEDPLYGHVLDAEGIRRANLAYLETPDDQVHIFDVPARRPQSTRARYLAAAPMTGGPRAIAKAVHRTLTGTT